MRPQGALDFSGQRMLWSDYQLGIFDAVADGEGHLAVRARAGTGKTTTICEAVRRMPRTASTLVLAFNKDIREVLARKLPTSVDVLTTHALGARALRRAQASSVLRLDRLRDLLKSDEFFPNIKDSPWRSAVKKMVSRGKATLARTPDDLHRLVDEAGVVLEDLVPRERRSRYGLSEEQRFELRSRLVEATGRALVHCAENLHEHDFDDMLWAPVVHGWPAGIWDRVVVDEAQDLSAVQLELIASVLAPDGRLLVVGDPRQAIYGFRGADRQAFERLVSRFGCQVLPLSLTYRCPRKVVELARLVVPDFEAGEGAPEGELREADELPLRELRAGDFVLSRKNAPLVRLAIQSLAAGLPVAIAGRELAKELGAILSALVQRLGNSRAAVVRFLEEKYRGRIAEAIERELDPQPLEDELACLLSLLEAQPSPADAVALLDRLCTEKPGNVVLFSSVHRAKGLERDRVFVLSSTFRTPLAGHNQGPGRSDAVEEENLWYVAITRTKSTLVLVRGEK